VKNKRRIPKIGVVRFWVDYSGHSVKRGVVERVAKTNAALRRRYTGIIAPPDFIRAPHVLLRDGRWTHWMPVDEFFCRRKAAAASLHGAMRAHSHAQRNSAADPIW